MKTVMYTEKDNQPNRLYAEPGSLVFVYRHPTLHRLVHDQVSAENLPAFLSSLREHSLSDALDSTDVYRTQDWRGRSPSFWPEWREAFSSAIDSDSLIKQQLVGIPGSRRQPKFAGAWVKDAA